jgi:hypothetical protein
MKNIIIEFLCRNQNKGYSSKEISQALSLKEEEINYVMLKLGLSDFLFDLTAGLISNRTSTKTIRARVRIEDVSVRGVTYFRCFKLDSDQGD